MFCVLSRVWVLRRYGRCAFLGRRQGREGVKQCKQWVHERLRHGCWRVYRTAGALRGAEKAFYRERARRFAGAKIALKSAFFRFCGMLSRAKCVALYISVFFIAGVSIYCGLTSFLFLTVRYVKAFGRDRISGNRLSSKAARQIFPSSFSFLYSFKPFFRL